jgi:hypothetical protein
MALSQLQSRDTVPLTFPLENSITVPYPEYKEPQQIDTTYIDYYQC